MKKSLLIFVIYSIVVLSITIILSIQILKGEIREPPHLGEVTELIRGEEPEDQFIRSLKEFQEIDEIIKIQEFNSLGFKDNEWQVTKPTNTYRIIALGDSMTFGAFVSNEFTWPKQLERKLNSLDLALKFEVFNMAGLEFDTGTPEELEILKKFGLKYKPDMIILQYYNNDWRSPEMKAKAKELWIKYERGEYKLPLKIETAIKELNATESVISRMIAEIVFEEYYRTMNWDEEWDKWTKKPLIEMIEITRERNIKLIVITWDSDEHQMDKLIPILENYSIPFYDFSEYLPWRSCPSSTRLPDCHLTPLGYEIVANRMLEIILKEMTVS